VSPTLATATHVALSPSSIQLLASSFQNLTVLGSGCALLGKRGGLEFVAPFKSGAPDGPGGILARGLGKKPIEAAFFYLRHRRWGSR
jgi:hypothetical protein